MHTPIYTPKNLSAQQIRIKSPGGDFTVTGARLTNNDGEPLTGTANWSEQLCAVQKLIEPHEYTALWAINGEAAVVVEGITINPFEQVSQQAREDLLGHIPSLQERLADLPCRIVLPHPDDIDVPGLTLWCVMPASAFHAITVQRISLVLDSAASRA